MFAAVMSVNKVATQVAYGCTQVGSQMGIIVAPPPPPHFLNVATEQLSDIERPHQRDQPTVVPLIIGGKLLSSK